jgi:hypothetical protein
MYASYLCPHLIPCVRSRAPCDWIETEIATFFSSLQ